MSTIYVVEIITYDEVNRKRSSEPLMAFKSVRTARDYCETRASESGNEIDWMDKDFLGFTGDAEKYIEYSIRRAKLV